MRKFTLSNTWYGGNFEMFKKKNIVLEEGLTVLVGCNGAGKTTLLKQIENNLNKNNIPVLYHNNLTNGVRALREKSLWTGDFSTLSRTVINSEGENIINVLEDIVREMGRMSQDNPNAKELWFLFDGVDSGLSIDNVIDIKESLIPLVIETEKNKDIYFVISANAYEFARNEKCFDVINGKYIKFKDYEEYREFILRTKGQKLKRYE